jgi:DmsE family decaheme c-type cytochrome
MHRAITEFLQILFGLLLVTSAIGRLLDNRGSPARALRRMRPGMTLWTAVGVLLLLTRAAAAQSVPGAGSESEFMGDAVCRSCHPQLDGYEHTVHGKVLGTRQGEARGQSCEACHGPGGAHVQAGGGRGVGALRSFRAEAPEALERENEACRSCHRSGSLLHWTGGPHAAADLACTSCHRIMAESGSPHLLRASELELCGDCHPIQRAQLARTSHMPVGEGKLACSSCHNPHGSTAEASLVRETTNETCYACHAEKRGPFLWEHPPVAESCLDCHEPHGSTKQAMLRTAPPRLCQECHMDTRHPSEARRSENRFVLERSCLQCHQNIHGSNHPSGFVFTR